MDEIRFFRNGPDKVGFPFTCSRTRADSAIEVLLLSVNGALINNLSCSLVVRSGGCMGCAGPLAVNWSSCIQSASIPHPVTVSPPPSLTHFSVLPTYPTTKRNTTTRPFNLTPVVSCRGPTLVLLPPLVPPTHGWDSSVGVYSRACMHTHTHMDMYFCDFFLETSLCLLGVVRSLILVFYIRLPLDPCPDVPYAKSVGREVDVNK